MIETRVVQMPHIEDIQLIYSDPEMAKIIIEQIAALKKRIALAEEQLKLLRLENIDSEI